MQTTDGSGIDFSDLIGPDMVGLVFSTGGGPEAGSGVGEGGAFASMDFLKASLESDRRKELRLCHAPSVWWVWPQQTAMHA